MFCKLFSTHSGIFRYLHEVCSPSIIHKNIKSSNILLDVELNPHLSDSGLASSIPNADQVIEFFSFLYLYMIQALSPFAAGDIVYYYR